MLDFRSVLAKYLNAQFAYVKNIKLCANILVKGVFTSDAEYSPFHGDTGQQLRVQSLPRDMSFPLTHHEDFSELYDYIRFPSEMDKLQSGIGPSRQGEVLKGRSVVEFVCQEKREGGRGGGERWGKVSERSRKSRFDDGAKGRLRKSQEVKLCSRFSSVSNCLYSPQPPRGAGSRVRSGVDQGGGGGVREIGRAPV